MICKESIFRGVPNNLILYKHFIILYYMNISSLRAFHKFMDRNFFNIGKVLSIYRFMGLKKFKFALIFFFTQKYFIKL